MTKAIDTFFQETSIYLPAYVVPEPSPDELFDPILAMNLAINAIDGHILELGQGPVVSYAIGPEISTVTVGQVGTYTFPSTIDNLARISTHLFSLSASPRFINAIQGLWPA